MCACSWCILGILYFTRGQACVDASLMLVILYIPFCTLSNVKAILVLIMSLQYITSSYVQLTDIQENTTGKAIGKMDMVLELCMITWRRRARGRCIYRSRFIMLLALTHAIVLYPTFRPPLFFLSRGICSFVRCCKLHAFQAGCILVKWCISSASTVMTKLETYTLHTQYFTTGRNDVLFFQNAASSCRQCHCPYAFKQVQLEPWHPPRSCHAKYLHRCYFKAFPQNSWIFWLYNLFFESWL